MILRNLVLKIFTAACVVLVLGLVSCATNKNVNAAVTYRVYTTNTKRVTLLPPNAMSQNINSLYLMNAEFGNDEFSVLAYVTADGNGISADLLSDFGTNLGTLVYDENGVITLDSEIFPKSLPPEYVVMDFQNAFYDAEKLQAAYEKSRLKFDVEFSEEEDCVVETRRIFDKEKLIEEIKIETFTNTNGDIETDELNIDENNNADGTSNENNNAVITITNFLRKYKYTLTEAE